jgi:hypothetical protein
MRLAEYTGSPVEDLYGPAPDFDVREYARTAVGSLREGLNLDAYASAPLGADTLRTLSFLQAIERSTMQHLRTVLVTPTHKDARVTAFLTTWAFEKYWIADALSGILSVHSAVPVARRRNAISRFFREIAERFEPIKESLVANQIGVEMIAVHMTIGAIDGWLTQAAYARLAQLDKNSELDSTIERILEIKARHLTFFEPQAEFRLSASTRAQKLTRKRLKRETWPIGAGDLAPASAKDFYSRLFATEPGLARSIDGAINGLPGLAGLGLIEKASA